MNIDISNAHCGPRILFPDHAWLRVVSVPRDCLRRCCRSLVASTTTTEMTRAYERSWTFAEGLRERASETLLLAGGKVGLARASTWASSEINTERARVRARSCCARGARERGVCVGSGRAECAERREPGGISASSRNPRCVRADGRGGASQLRIRHRRTRRVRVPSSRPSSPTHKPTDPIPSPSEEARAARRCVVVVVWHDVCRDPNWSISTDTLCAGANDVSSGGESPRESRPRCPSPRISSEILRARKCEK